jgi:hypothetical protein
MPAGSATAPGYPASRANLCTTPLIISCRVYVPSRPRQEVAWCPNQPCWPLAQLRHFQVSLPAGRTYSGAPSTPQGRRAEMLVHHVQSQVPQGQSTHPSTLVRHEVGEEVRLVDLAARGVDVVENSLVHQSRQEALRLGQDHIQAKSGRESRRPTASGPTPLPAPLPE